MLSNDRGEEGMERECWCRLFENKGHKPRGGEVRWGRENKISEGKVIASVLPYGQVLAWGKEMRMKREMKRNQPSFPEIKVMVQGIVLVPLWVCPSCSSRPADSMLQSGTLFTFWTQLTSPSLGPSVLPSPALHFSLSLSCLPPSASLSLSLSNFSLASNYSPASQGVPLAVVSQKLPPLRSEDDVTALEWKQAPALYA